jgi:hypothetical protein
MVTLMGVLGGLRFTNSRVIFNFEMFYKANWDRQACSRCQGSGRIDLPGQDVAFE